MTSTFSQHEKHLIGKHSQIILGPFLFCWHLTWGKIWRKIRSNDNLSNNDCKWVKCLIFLTKFYSKFLSQYMYYSYFHNWLRSSLLNKRQHFLRQCKLFAQCLTLLIIAISNGKRFDVCIAPTFPLLTYLPIQSRENVTGFHLLLDFPDKKVPELKLLKIKKGTQIINNLFLFLFQNNITYIR